MERYTSLIRKMGNHALVQKTELQADLKQRKVLQLTAVRPQIISKVYYDRILQHPLSADNIKALQDFVQQLKLKGHSERVPSRLS